MHDMYKPVECSSRTGLTSCSVEAPCNPMYWAALGAWTVVAATALTSDCTQSKFCPCILTSASARAVNLAPAL